MTFEVLDAIKSDSILGLLADFRSDPAENKIDLTAGVYKNREGETPVMAAVSEAEKAIIESQTTKTYLSPIGSEVFRTEISRLILGDTYTDVQDRLSTMQTTGGCGALRVGAELYKRANPEGAVWVSDPTWPNHLGICSATGLKIDTYPYYDVRSKRLLIDDLLSKLAEVPSGSLILLQASCHNPAGCDPNETEWSDILDVVEDRRLVPYFDIAYQGLGSTLDDDAYAIRAAATRLPEVLVATTFSKNFGLYRERTGALLVLSNNAKESAAVETHTKNIARGLYSMPPAHGALIVEKILSDEALSNLWKSELELMAARLKHLRDAFATTYSELRPGEDVSWIRDQIGLFSLMGISPEQVDDLKNNQHIYVVRNGRINIAGLSEQNIPIVANAFAQIN